MAYGGKQTLYDILELPRDAEPLEITRAYRRLNAELNKEYAAPNPRKAALVHEAYEVLSDPRKRAEYDRSLKTARFLGTAPGEKPQRRGLLAVLVLGVAAGGAWYYFQGRTDAALSAPSLGQQEVHTAASLSVGRVNRVEMTGARAGLGVAVAIEEGVMLAPCEGIAPGTQLLVRIPPRDIPAQLGAADSALGLCKLNVTGGASWPLPMSGLVPRIGDRVYAVNLGPLGEVVVSPGEVKKITPVAMGRAIESTARAGTPLEGSPLLDAEGRVIAIAMKGQHTTLPSAWIVDLPVARKRPPPERAPEPEAAAEGAPAPDEDPRLKNVSPERRERLEKAFRPPPSVPKDL